MAVTVKRCTTVKPLGHTWQGVMSLTMLDQSDSITHEPTVYFYRQPPSEWLSSHKALADALKDSLSRALEHFYPLAGRLRWCKEGKGRLELHCNAEGAEFIEAEADSELEHLVEHGFPQQKNLRHLFPDYGKMYKTLPFEEIPLMFVQLTTFACGGVALSVALSHVIVDGSACGHFMSEWARLTRGEELKLAPILDRSILGAGETPSVSIPAEPADDSDLPTLIKPKGSDHNQEEELIKLDQFSTVRLRLGKEHVEKVKKIANEGRDESKIARPYSRYEALAAHMWRCVSKAQRHEFPEQPTALAVPIDFRSRVKPPLPWNYFGNVASAPLAYSTSGELISKPLRYAASVIRETIEGANEEFMWKKIGWLNSLSDLTCTQNLYECLADIPDIMNPNLCVASWLTLPIFGVDFGWGKEVYLDRGEIEGAYSYFLPCPSGDGSIILVSCLQTSHIDSFKEHLYGDIV